jgi:RsiW-degrading membrane proteinase PrsW (M82 family)
LLAVAPAGLLLKYVLVRDKYKREPRRLIGITFLLGALGIIPATIIELLLGFNNILVTTFLSVAVVEETMKYLAVRVKAYNSSSFKEVMDGIVYGVAAGLGFATIENIFYVLGFGTVSTALIRAFMSVPSHAAYGGIMGFYLGMARPFRLSSKQHERKLILMGLAIAILLHGLYDTIAFTLEGFAGLVGLLVMTAISWIILLRLIKKALSLSPVRWGAPSPYPVTHQTYPNRFCTQCGFQRESDSRFCVNCGQGFEQSI